MTDPKPPAASGDRYDEMAEALRNAADTSDAAVSGALRAAAKEAQLLVLDEYRALVSKEKACQRVNDEAMIAAAGALDRLRSLVQKEGPL